MKVTIVCVGKLKEKYWRDAIAEYSKRLSRYMKLEIIELADEKAPETMSPAQEAEVKEKEGQRILKNVKGDAFVVALAVAWALKIEQKKEKLNFKEALLQPEIILIGFFTGMFRWMNFWDFPIYFVVGGSVVFFMNIRQYRDSLKDFCLVTAAQAAEVFLVGMAACLPFTMTFDTIASEIKLAYTHSAFYQLMVLWGLPAITVICFIVSCVMAYRKKCKNCDEKAAFLGSFEKIPVEDLVIVLFGLCALGLIVMPEVIYVQAIYPNAPRANTMFKLTYQAYMLFAISMGYALCKGLMQKKKHKWVFAASVAGLSCLLLTAGYLPALPS